MALIEYDFTVACEALKYIALYQGYPILIIRIKLSKTSKSNGLWTCILFY